MTDHDALLRRLIKAGWSVGKKSRHLKVISPDGRTISFVSSGDPRAIKNWVAKHAPEVKK